jgi:hypothetical protein
MTATPVPGPVQRRGASRPLAFPTRTSSATVSCVNAKAFRSDARANVGSSRAFAVATEVLIWADNAPQRSSKCAAQIDGYAWATSRRPRNAICPRREGSRRSPPSASSGCEAGARHVADMRRIGIAEYCAALLIGSTGERPLSEYVSEVVCQCKSFLVARRGECL